MKYKAEKIEELLESDFTAYTDEPSITWREFFARLCNGYGAIMCERKDREDWFVIDEVSPEQYPETWMANDLTIVEPKIAIKWDDDGFIDEIDWKLCRKVYEAVVDYVVSP